MWNRFRAALVALLVAGLAAPAFASDVGVQLSLAEYQKLLAAEKGPTVTVIDSLVLAGSFDARNLTVTLTGRAFGKKQPVPVLSSPGAVRLYGCQGPGVIQRDDSDFSLTPLADKFSVTCQLASPTNDRLELTTTSSVLWVQSSVTDGDLVETDAADGSRTLSIVRKTAGSTDVVKLAATGHYQITLRPGETGFRYEVDVQNPNRIHQPFTLSLSSGEHVQKVDATVGYDVSGTSYRFDLPPGDSTVSLTGTLSASSFTPPVAASVQYLLLEADPLLRLTVPKPPRRISPQESGMTPRFRGAQAFLLSTGETTSWSVKKLEVLRTTSFAITSAEHKLYVSRDGEAIGESAYAIDNQGAADLALPMKAEPTYAALDGQAVLLTKNAAGNLWTPLSAGTQTLTVQDRQHVKRRLGFAWGTLWLPEMGTPASSASIEVAYPKHWLPLFASFRGDTRTAVPSTPTLFWLVVIAVWTGILAASLGFKPRKRILLAIAAGVCVLVAGWATAIVVIADAALSLVLIWRRLRGHKWLGTILGAAAFFVLLFVVGEMMGGNRFEAATSGLAGSPSPAGYYGAKERTMKNYDWRGSNGLVVIGNAPSPAATAPQTYEGLPAKIQIPPGARSTWFSAELLRTDPPRGVHVLLVADWIVEWVEALLALIALALIVREQRAIREGWRTLFPAQPSPAPAPQP